MENNENSIPIKSWCANADETALEQSRNLADHPVVKDHVCLMPDAHAGYGMPIGGVIACENAVIPNAVGVDIGCGMGAIKTNLNAGQFNGMAHLREIINAIKSRIPVGEGRAHKDAAHIAAIEWNGFEEWMASVENSGVPQWWTQKSHNLDMCNLGTLGGGNHFIEIQKSETGDVWIMLHSGSRNMGQRIASHYHNEAKNLNAQMNIELPDTHLAFLPAEHDAGKNYIRDMNHALAYAFENRRLMMRELKEIFADFFPAVEYLMEVNIHHNYAAPEEHNGQRYWIHRKGATSAQKMELGIIPGSMGTSSYIVEGLGNPESFMSCSHGAGRRLGRSQANHTLTVEECELAMQGVVYDRFGYSRARGSGGKKMLDLSEAPPAYKDIDEVIQAENDLVKPIVKLSPLAVVKG